MPYCRHYSYPDLAAFDRSFEAERPGGGSVYSWNDDQAVLAELGQPSLARYVSNKMLVVTIFGHKHLKHKFDIFHVKFSTII